MISEITDKPRNIQCTCNREMQETIQLIRRKFRCSSDAQAVRIAIEEMGRIIKEEIEISNTSNNNNSKNVSVGEEPSELNVQQ